ncbi:MAG: hypothetical protein K2L05_04050 [Muribaculaceae bacterium]|nr:hypothetical protein [Muribaculaceae bacterium]
MSKKIFNIGPETGAGGWKETSAFDAQLDKYDEFSGNQKARKNPRVAVPSPYARIQILQEAFGTVRDKRADDRDFMLVSQMLDIFELIFEGGLDKYGLQVTQIDLDGITDHLESYGETTGKTGIGLLGKTLKDYAARETFGLKENKELYVIHRLDDTLAITSPTSVLLPAPDLSEQYGRDKWADIIIEGKRPIFSQEQELIERSPEFICFVYTWFGALKQSNNGTAPEPMDNFGKYLENQRQKAGRELTAIIEEAERASIELEYEEIQATGGLIPQIWHTAFYTHKAQKLTDGIASHSDLLLSPATECNKGGLMPLILTNNNKSRQMVYTSSTTMWDDSKSGLDYSDPITKETEPSRRQLPNGVQYEGGFIYEHDFLADTIIELPYKFNDEMFFSGNPSGVRCNLTGFIPPIKEKFFEYFTLEDLKKNLSMVLKGSDDNVSMVEVSLKLPTTTNKSIVLKKTYRRADSIADAINNVTSDASEATGMIAPQCAVALTTLPFVRAFVEKNYYAFQLVRESFGFEDFEVKLSAVDMQNPEANTDNFHGYVRRKENGVATVKSYVLNGGNFDYLKLTFAEKNDDKLDALLIPLKELQPYEYRKDAELEFCFDFGTSNTFIAVKDNKGEFLDFTLPTDSKFMVQTYVPDQENTALFSFEEYCRQELLPTFNRDRKPFPISTVLSIPQNSDNTAGVGDTEECLPFLCSAIPFIFGTEDYGQQYNDIIDNLKWQFKDKDGKESYTVAFINEVVFLAQLLAISKGAELEKCKIVWTYPLSMPESYIRELQEYWNAAYAKFFKGDFSASDATEHKEVNSFPESMAPMIYLLNHSAKGEDGTSVSIDIGGGTCDIVIIPDDEIDELKLASIGFGADCIFGIKEQIGNIPMFRNAIKYIMTTINKYATDRNPNKAEFDKTANYLKSLLDGNKKAPEVATYLFGLPNKKELASIKDDLSFNKFLQKQPAYHHIFIYYYAALMYYVTSLCDAIEDAEKPSKIFYSGSGSKLLAIFSKSKSSVLVDYSTSLFNSFAKNLSKTERADEIAIKVEQEQPKQITAKGAIIDTKNDSDSSKLQTELKKPEKAKNRTFLHYMLPFEELSYAELNEDNVKEAVAQSVIDFHSKLAEFMEANSDELFEDIVTENMKDSFLDIEERKISKKVSSVLKKLSRQSKKNTDIYKDVPFFAVIKRLILDVLIPD